MLRVRLSFLAAAIALAPALAGCSGGSLSSYVPDWLQFKPAAPPTEALQFESQPAGAEVRTAQGQACITPCSLALPVAAQGVTFALNGFIPQTVQLDLAQSGDLVPNPVDVALQPVPPPPKPVRRPPPRRRPRPAPPQAAAPPSQAAPPPAASPFPPPPPPQH
jgi:hypothetical protein